MMKLRSTILYKFVLIGIVLVMSLWIFLVAPELKSQFNTYDVIYEQRGLDRIASSYGSELSEPFIIEEVTTQSIKNKHNNLLEIDSIVIGTNLETNEIVFQDQNMFLVDPKTHKHSDETLGYFSLPFNTEKKNYFGYNALLFAPTHLIFEEELMLHGLTVYKFSCDSIGIESTDSFPQFAPHQTKFDYECDMWIEPITGNIVDFKASWNTYFVEDGIRTYDAEIGGKENSDTTDLELLSLTRTEIDIINLYEKTIPIVIGIIGIIIFSGITVRNILQKSKKLEASQKILKEKSKSLQEDKLKLLGTLTSVLLHDIKNPLTVLANESFLLKHNLGEINEQTKKSFKRLDTAISRIIDQTESVMNFIKEKQIHIKKNDLSDMINESINTTDIPSTIKLNLDISKQEIECDRTLMVNVFSNLLKNAVDATKDGEISIQTINNKGNSIQILFRDSGSGILDDNLEKIFEYFSTTKNEGTGIGLAECKSTVEMHGGSINVKNNDGPGVTFTILFPKKQ